MNKIIIKVFFFFNLLIFSSFSSLAETFVYSGGCFWCTEADTEKLKGVNEVISGFTAGTTKDPKYIPGQWGDHREAALVKYNPKIIELNSFGNSKLEKTLFLVHLTDWISWFLSELNNVDAIEIDVINYLKSELSKIN